MELKKQLKDREHMVCGINKRDSDKCKRVETKWIKKETREVGKLVIRYNDTVLFELYSTPVHFEGLL